jgi:hypothetical protein
LDDNLEQFAFIEVPPAAARPVTDFLSRKRSIDENGFAVDGRDTPAILTQIVDAG